MYKFFNVERAIYKIPEMKVIGTPVYFGVVHVLITHEASLGTSPIKSDPEEHHRIYSQQKTVFTAVFVVQYQSSNIKHLLCKVNEFMIPPSQYHQGIFSDFVLFVFLIFPNCHIFGLAFGFFEFGVEDTSGYDRLYIDNNAVHQWVEA